MTAFATTLKRAQLIVPFANPCFLPVARAMQSYDLPLSQISKKHKLPQNFIKVNIARRGNPQLKTYTVPLRIISRAPNKKLNPT